MALSFKSALLICLAFVGAGADAPASKPKRKWCNTTVHGFAGDYAYEACGSFCKEAKATNHCKFCKCRACSFCANKGTSAAKTTLASDAAAPSTTSAADAGKRRRGGAVLKKAKKQAKRAKAEAAASAVTEQQTAAVASKPKKLKKLKKKKTTD